MFLNCITFAIIGEGTKPIFDREELEVDVGTSEFKEGRSVVAVNSIKNDRARSPERNVTSSASSRRYSRSQSPRRSSR